jgi:hypothetical protein
MRLKDHVGLPRQPKTIRIRSVENSGRRGWLSRLLGARHANADNERQRPSSSEGVDRHCPKRSPMRASVAEISVMNSSPQPFRCSSYHSAALRNSTRASGCSSTRTPLLEFLSDLCADGLPSHGLDATFGNIAGTALQLSGPRRRDFIVRLFETGEQFLGDSRALPSRQTQRLGEQFLGRHEFSVPARLSGNVAPGFVSLPALQSLKDLEQVSRVEDIGRSPPQKQRLQQVFLPGGVRYDGTRLVGTGAMLPVFNCLKRCFGAEKVLVDQTGVSWNHLASWLRQLDELRTIAYVSSWSRRRAVRHFVRGAIRRSSSKKLRMSTNRFC